MDHNSSTTKTKVDVIFEKESTCEIAELNMCIISMILLFASSLEEGAQLAVAMTCMQRIENEWAHLRDAGRQTVSP